MMMAASFLRRKKQLPPRWKGREACSDSRAEQIMAKRKKNRGSWPSAPRSIIHVLAFLCLCLCLCCTHAGRGGWYVGPPQQLTRSELFVYVYAPHLLAAVGACVETRRGGDRDADESNAAAPPAAPCFAFRVAWPGLAVPVLSSSRGRRAAAASYDGVSCPGVVLLLPFRPPSAARHHPPPKIKHSSGGVWTLEWSGGHPSRSKRRSIAACSILHGWMDGGGFLCFCLGTTRIHPSISVMLALHHQQRFRLF
jgi:hypothetical protein